MKLHLHDHSGHLFTAQLSRHLAGLGHQVVHGFSTQFESPHGRLRVESDDPPTLRMAPTAARAPFSKYSPLRRTRYEVSYARAWQEHLDANPVDVVLACNVPLFTLARMRRYFARSGTPWVLWHQDIYSRAVADEAARALPAPAAALVRAYVERLERAQVADADVVVAISDEFVRQYERWQVPIEHVRVLPNWAPTDEVRPGERDNAWARQQQLPEQGLRLMYAGTVGRKHNPMLLVDLLDSVQGAGIDANLTVVSEGVAAEDLARATAGRVDVRVLPFQPAEQLSDVLASADICVVLLEPSAAQFSVPSKVLSYLASGRPTIALLPERNAAAADVKAAGGFVAPPSSAGVQQAASWITSVWADESERTRIGRLAREHALSRFEIRTIGAAFEDLLESAISGRKSRNRAARL